MENMYCIVCSNLKLELVRTTYFFCKENVGMLQKFYKFFSSEILYSHCAAGKFWAAKWSKILFKKYFWYPNAYGQLQNREIEEL